MSEACKHPNWRLSAGLWSSATPVPWTCPDCGSRGTIVIVDSSDQGVPASELAAISAELSFIGAELSALGSEISAISSEPLADKSPELVSLSHRRR